jgi:ribonucleoside-diphosphate reductase alpha chain
MIAFEGFEAHMKNLEIAKHIDEESLRASEDLAVLLGEPEWCEGFGVRNTHRIAIAPTKSTANLMGGVSEGINPDPAFVYTASGAAGEMDRINPILLKLMKDRGVYTKAVVADLADKQGSVQHVEWLNDDEKAVFKTAFEINMDAVLRMAATRGKYVDQWQSVNLFFAADEDEGYIAEIHQKAFKDPSILALYYIYTQAGVQAAKGECEACQ